MCNFRVVLLTLGAIIILSIATAESRRPTSRPRRQPPPPLYLYPGPHPPSRKRPNASSRRPLRQSSPSYHSDSIYNDPESPYRSPHSRPPSLYSQYDEFSNNAPYNRPHKSKKPSYPRGPPPPSKKHPYYSSASSHKPSRPQLSQSNSPYLKPYHSETIPKETIATFVNRPSSGYKGTPTLSYNGYSGKPSVSYGPPYPPKPFKSYGVPASSHDYVEEEYNDDEEMYGSHLHSTAIQNPIIKSQSPNFASSHFSFENGNTAVQYFNDAHNIAATNAYSTKVPDIDVLVDPHPMRPTPSPPGPFKPRNRKRPQREDESQNIAVSTSRPFKTNNVIRHPLPPSQYPAVELSGPNFKYPGPEIKANYPQVDLNNAYKQQHERYPMIKGPTPNYPSHEVYPTTEVVSGNRPNKFSVKEVFPQHGGSAADVLPGDDQIRNNYDHFLKETFKTPKQTQEYEDHAETTVAPANYQTPRTRGSSKYRERQRNAAANRSKNRVRTQPPKQYEVHDDPEEREDIPDNHKEFEYVE